mmetsp:Transcript_2488/g.3085  ORF Transcript_2488/g.3085 Transcript_2488/m.3085 type:complete len:95 (-) Transcript_2488:67-351(-)
MIHVYCLLAYTLFDHHQYRRCNHDFDVSVVGFTTSYNLTMAAANNGAFFDDTEADVRVLQDGVSLTAHKGAPPQTITDLTVFGMIYVANNYTAP